MPLSRYPGESNDLSSYLRLYVLTDHQWSKGRDNLTVVKAAIDGGATTIQLRNKVANTKTLIEEGLALRALTRERGVLLIINDRIDVALAIDADGAHVGQDDMPAPLARELLGPNRILGVSIANSAEAEMAIAAGADYLAVSPVFSTLTKTDTPPATGIQFLTELATQHKIPLVAIGGINTENATEIIRAGATGVAVVTAVVSAEDITGAARQLRQAIERGIA